MFSATSDVGSTRDKESAAVDSILCSPRRADDSVSAIALRMLLDSGAAQHYVDAKELYFWQVQQRSGTRRSDHRVHAVGGIMQISV